MARNIEQSQGEENEEVQEKPPFFIISAQDDLCELPEDVKGEIGYSLYIAQCGGTPDNAKPLRGREFRGVWEIVSRHQTDKYRGVYTIRFKKAVYVLHCFMKKSKIGIDMTQQDKELILKRLQRAQEDYQELFGEDD